MRYVDIQKALMFGVFLKVAKSSLRSKTSPTSPPFCSKKNRFWSHPPKGALSLPGCLAHLGEVLNAGLQVDLAQCQSSVPAERSLGCCLGVMGDWGRSGLNVGKLWFESTYRLYIL